MEYYCCKGCHLSEEHIVSILLEGYICPRCKEKVDMIMLEGGKILSIEEYEQLKEVQGPLMNKAVENFIVTKISSRYYSLNLIEFNIWLQFVFSTYKLNEEFTWNFEQAYLKKNRIFPCVTRDYQMDICTYLLDLSGHSFKGGCRKIFNLVKANSLDFNGELFSYLKI